MADKTTVLGLSDPLVMPTGFGRVARELWTRLPQEKYRLAYISRWIGSSRFPGVVTYGARSEYARDELSSAAFDLVGEGGPFVLWTLLDPWMTSWIAVPETSPLRTPSSLKFLRQHRGSFVWIGHFPIDGAGPGNGPPRWTGQYLSAMDIPVAMCEWARRLCQPVVRKDIRVIPHAVNDHFYPDDRAQARHTFQFQYFSAVVQALKIERAQRNGTDEPSMEMAEEAAKRAFRLDDRFTVICVMANRRRKHWRTVLEAFRLLVADVPQARFIGICGDRTGTGDGDALPLEDVCRELGLRLDDEADDPNVWLIERVSDNDGSHGDTTMRKLYSAADCAILISGGEGFGLPQLEAHACGLPCIAGDYTASSELAVHSRELVPPHGYVLEGQNEVKRPIYSPRDVADRLRYAVKNPSWRRDVGAKGIEQAAKHRWDVILPQWVELFDEAGLMLAQAAAEAGRTDPEASDERESVPAQSS